MSDHNHAMQVSARYEPSTHTIVVECLKCFDEASDYMKKFGKPLPKNPVDGTFPGVYTFAVLHNV